MKTILIPTDFSGNSDNALMYALELNKQFHAKLALFHSYFIPIPATDIPLPVYDDKEIRSESMKIMGDLRDKIAKMYPGHGFETELLLAEGVACDEIVTMAKKKNADLIVMGTKGAHGLQQVLMGTNAADVIEKAVCPVLAIPENSVFNGIRKIVFATNYAENDFANIGSAIDFAKRFDAEVILLHISTGKLSKGFEFNSIESFKERIKEDSGYDKVSYKLFEDAHVEEGIHLYLEEIKADIISMTNRHRSMFRKLFNPSLTKKMAFHTHVPILAFHEDDTAGDLSWSSMETAMASLAHLKII